MISEGAAMRWVGLICLLISVQAQSCRQNGPAPLLDPAGPPKDRVANGAWGGDHVGMDVTDSGAVLEYDCAHGTIDEPLLIDAGGSFDVAGTHIREHGGPAVEEEKPDTHPARYAGSVRETKMTLIVRLTDTGEEVGTFTLALGQGPGITKCL